MGILSDLEIVIAFCQIRNDVMALTGMPDTVVLTGRVLAGTLMSTSMFTTLHGEENKPANGWRISRFKFFVSFLTSAR